MSLDPTRIHRIQSGEDRSLPAALLRAAATVVEPNYTFFVRLRNRAFDLRRRPLHELDRPTVSVGNITTGGTGKTPVVRWLADRLRRAGRRPAVLMRGYGGDGGGSDEQRVLEDSLNDRSDFPAIPVVANPDRVAGSHAALQRERAIDSFVLDDGFQHRQVGRRYDLVLVNAAQPFGFGHVLPRGLLREPMEGLQRASAFLITRCSAVTPQRLAEIETQLRRYNVVGSIFHCDHVHAGVERWPGGERQSLQDLAEQRMLGFCGVGDPESFGQQLRRIGTLAAHQWFADHHAYTAADVRQLQQAAAESGASCLVTTQKDWVKLAPLIPADLPIPLYVVQLELQFREDDGDRLLAEVGAALETASA